MGSTFYLVLCGIVPVILIFVIIGVRDRATIAADRAIGEAYTAYQTSLAALKAQPTNPDLRQKTLAQGRVYSILTRNQQGVTVYDEMAVMNDINAATAGALTATPAPAAPASSVKDRLAKLEELRAEGLISYAEYADRRQKILDEL